MGKNPKNGLLTMKHKVGYALGDWGGCMTFALMSGMFTRYCLNVLHVSSTVLAGLLLVWNVWDAVNDPLMGALMDKIFAKSKNPKGKFRPWMLRATPMIAITSIALWTLPTLFEGMAMLVALFVCKILYEACYTMFNIPYGSLLSAMSDTDRERAALSSSRGFGSMIGNMIPMMLMPILLEMYGDTPTGFGIGVTVCAVIGFVCCFFSYKFTEERNIVESKPDAADNIKFTDILEVFKKNRAFLALCLHGICVCCMQSVAGTLGTYMYEDVLGSIGMMSMASAISAPMSLIFLVGAPKVSAKLGLERMIRYGLVLSAVMFAVLFGAHLIMDVNIWVHIIVSGLATGFTSLSILMQWGLVGEAIDYNEFLTGKRTEGSIYGTFNLSRRIGTTIGNSAAVLMLGWIGYDAALDVQTAGTITGIKALCVLLPGIFALGSWAAFKFVWNITPAIREKMQAAKAAKTAEQ